MATHIHTCYATWALTSLWGRIHPRVLSELVEQLAKPLSIIDQQPWLTGEVPDDWTIANLTHIYTDGTSHLKF